MIRNQGSLTSEDLKELRSGTASVVNNNFVPHALTKVNVKTLLVDDKDYSTTGDHLFAYLAQKQDQSMRQRQENDLNVFKKMELSGNMSDVIPTPMTDLLEMEPEKPVYHTDFSSYSGVPKHSKKDYEYLNNMSV